MNQTRKLVCSMAVAGALALAVLPMNLGATLGIGVRPGSTSTTPGATSATTSPATKSGVTKSGVTSRTTKKTSQKKKSAASSSSGKATAKTSSASTIAVRAADTVNRSFPAKAGVKYEVSGEARSPSKNSQLTLRVTAGAERTEHRKTTGPADSWQRISFHVEATAPSVDVEISAATSSLEVRNLVMVRASTLPSGVAEVTSESRWNPIWADEFDGASLDRSVWATQEAWYPLGANDKIGSDAYNPPDPVASGNIGIESSDGTSALRISALREPNPLGLALTSGELYARPRSPGQQFGQFTNGYLEARIKAPESNWLWPAFWLMGNGTGSEGWPKTGEIDIFEFVNSPSSENPDFPRQRPFFTVIWGCQQTMNYCKRGRNNPYPDPIDQGSWHTYGLLRLPDRLVTYIDGRETFTLLRTSEASTSETGANLAEQAPTNPIFTAPMHVRITLGAGNWGTSVGEAAEPGNLLVDYIRAYEIESCGGPCEESAKR
jgi:beta-glucanase (GH16 family)